jgi:hypothetical protein
VASCFVVEVVVDAAVGIPSCLREEAVVVWDHHEQREVVAVVVAAEEEVVVSWRRMALEDALLGLARVSVEHSVPECALPLVAPELDRQPREDHLHRQEVQFCILLVRRY